MNRSSEAEEMLDKLDPPEPDGERAPNLLAA
jgi:hypothetical protein